MHLHLQTSHHREQKVHNDLRSPKKKTKNKGEGTQSDNEHKSIATIHSNILAYINAMANLHTTNIP